MGDSVAEKLELVENVSDVAPENRNVLDGFIRENAAMTLKPSMFQTTNEESFVENTCNKYKAITSIPLLSSARVLKKVHGDSHQKYSILARYSQQDLVNKKAVKFEKTMTVEVNREADTVHVDESPALMQCDSVLLQSISNDGKFRAIIRKDLRKNEKAKYVLEVWSDCSMHKAIDLSAFDAHGDVYTDDTFSSLQWSPNCRKIVYVAERKKEKSSSYFDQECHNISSGKEGMEKKSKGQEFVYEEDWGEQETNLCSPVIAVVDIIKESLEVLDAVPSYLSPGQAIWASNECVIFVGWWNDPFKLGVVYCHNRRSAIFQLMLNCSERKCTQLSNDCCSVHSPSVSPDYSKLIFLEREEGGPHEGCKRLMMYDMTLKSKCSVVYDMIEIASDLEIPLYTMSINEHSWLPTGDFVLLDTIFQCSKIIVMIELKTGKSTKLTSEDGVWSLQDIYSNVIFATFSSPTTPSTLMVGELVNGNQVSWRQVKSQGTSTVHSSLKDALTWTRFCLPSLDLEKSVVMESILVRPILPTSTKQPLIIWPHGGPHSCAVASFSSYTASFALIGCAILLVNYRGSTGFGEFPLQSLLGKVGVQDVMDVQRFAEAALETREFDSRNIFLFGGSHGGFLSAHLVAKYPDFYRACALRNPVLDLPGMVGITDIPDWCYVETGFNYGYATIPSKSSYCQMLERSPIVFAREVRCPIMLLLGGKDCRVPPSQGKSFYRTLKAMEKPVRMYWYPEDSHALKRTETEADVFVNVAKWFHAHSEK